MCVAVGLGLGVNVLMQNATMLSAPPARVTNRACTAGASNRVVLDGCVVGEAQADRSDLCHCLDLGRR